jgi:hypothetical protein
VADGTIYLYFKNKEDILLQFFNRRTQEVFDRFRSEVEKAENARDKLVNLIRSHLEEFQHDKAMAIVFQSEARVKSRLNGRLDRYVKDLSKKYMDLVGEIVELGQAEGGIRKDVYISLVKTPGSRVGGRGHQHLGQYGWSLRHDFHGRTAGGSLFQGNRQRRVGCSSVISSYISIKEKAQWHNLLRIGGTWILFCMNSFRVGKTEQTRKISRNSTENRGYDRIRSPEPGHQGDPAHPENQHGRHV